MPNNYVTTDHCYFSNNKLLDKHIKPYHTINIWVDNAQITNPVNPVGLTYGELLNAIRERYGTQKVDIGATMNPNSVYHQSCGWFVYRMINIFYDEYTGETKVSYARQVDYFS